MDESHHFVSLLSWATTKRQDRYCRKAVQWKRLWIMGQKTQTLALVLETPRQGVSKLLFLPLVTSDSSTIKWSDGSLTSLTLGSTSTLGSSHFRWDTGKHSQLRGSTQQTRMWAFESPGVLENAALPSCREEQHWRPTTAPFQQWCWKQWATLPPAVYTSPSHRTHT